jgi:hypothetical protein
VVGAAALAHLPSNTSQYSHEWKPVQTAGLTAALVLAMLFIYAGNQSPFLYFQF